MGTRLHLALAALAALAITTLGCGPGEAKAPNPTRPLDERRAIEVIRRAIKSEGMDPAPGRDEPLPSARKPIHIDVGVAGRSFGVAYISQEDAEALGDALPAPNKRDEKLKIVRCGDDAQTRVVLLFQQNYLYDDQIGEAHEQTTITAERSLARDTEDFMTYARTQKLK
jgi:hypothetical protein